MDLPIENSYGFFRVDERCKKLERTVKMLQLKQLEKKNTDNCAPDTGTNISNINGDAFDTTYTHSSKLGSEIVSSSTNMKNLFAHKIHSHNNNNNIATSSVKNSFNNDPARAIMPPPKSIPAFGNPSRKNTPATCEVFTLNQKRGPTGLGPNHLHPTLSVISSIKCPSSLQADSPIKYKNSEKVRKNVADTIKPDRIFERWKVMINDKGQLIIRGILKGCKNNVRSKPVIRRIDSTVVQSCFNHIYELQGCIYDDKHDLPEYVRRKFYNGFPVDWENVFQLWRSYISGGCKPSFRWPTPVTDSDDDLISDITELTDPQEGKRSRSRIKNRYDSVPVEKTVKKPPKTISPKSSKMTTEKAKSPEQTIQNVTNKSSKKTASLSEKTNDTSVEGNPLIENIHDQYCNNLSTTNQTIDEETSNVVINILNSKNCSIEYIDKIIEKLNFYKYFITSKPQNSSANFSSNNPSIVATERVPLIEPASNNSNVTNTKVGNTQNHTPKYLISHSVQNHSYDFDSVSKPSPSGSNVPSIEKVRRELYKQDYESSELSESDTEVKRRKSPKKVSKTYKNRKTAEATSTEKQPLSRVNDDSDDEFIPKKVVHSDRCNTHTNKPVNNVYSQVNEVDFEGFTKPMPKIQAQNLPNNFINTNLPPSKYHRQRKADSPSTVTGFLTNYDSCVSISEDDRRVHTPRPKSDDKRTVNDIDGKTLSSFKLKLNQENPNSYYDSSVSITEDEMKYVDNRINGPHIRKQILQEPNIQCFQQMLKRNFKQKINNTGFFDQKHLQNHPAVNDQFSSLQSNNFKDVSKHTSGNLNDNKENKSNQIEEENQSNQHLSGIFQTSANKLQEKIKPSIISVEEVSYDVDDLLSNTCREESIKNDSSKNKRSKNGSKENNSLPILSISNNVSNATNSKSLELDFKLACKNVSVQLEDIKNTFKQNTKKKVNESNRSNESISSIDITSAPQSSRGRRILPTLSYWSGERLSVKGDNTIYTPPTSFSSFIGIGNEQIIENNKALKESIGPKTKKEEAKLRRTYRKRKEFVKLNKLIEDSDASSEEERPVLKRRKNRFENLNENNNERKSSFDKNGEKKLKRRESVGDKQKNISPINSNKVTVKYYKTTSRKNDFSEYESSICG